MSAYVIDGTLCVADIKWSRKGKTYFAGLTIKKSDGSEAALGKVLATDAVAEHISVSSEGRFYLFKSMGITGLCGVRFADGRELQAYPGDQNMVFASMAMAAVVLNILYILTRDSISILALILTLLGAFGWYWCRKVRREIEQLWRDDSGKFGTEPARNVASITLN
ncbi:MAG: hypothetical protein ACRCY3_14565 [Sphingorhabdus sp.]